MRQITADSTSNASTIVSLRDNSYVTQGHLHLNGHARFINTTDVGVVRVDIGFNTFPYSACCFYARLDDPKAQFTAWTIDLDLTQGFQAYTLTPSPYRTPNPPPPTQVSGSATTQTDRVQATAAVLTVNYTNGTPSVCFASPAAGTVVSQTMLLSGTANTPNASVKAVDVSLDGGTTWLPASLNGGNWSFAWTPAPNNDRTSIQILARVTDAANEQRTAARTFIVDNIAPDPLDPTFNLPQGIHLQGSQTLTITWAPPSDPSSPVTVLVAVDQISDTVPTQPVNGTSDTAALSGSGVWYAHIALRDAAGNTDLRDYGPWYIGQPPAVGVCPLPQQTIVQDGVIDLVHNEWSNANDLLDYDSRSGNPQALYTQWDGQAMHIAWQGATWNIDGAQWAYISTGNGTTTPVAGSGVGGTLPFAVQYAVKVDGNTSGTLYTWNGTQWAAQSGSFFAHSARDTEITVPWTLLPPILCAAWHPSP